MFENRTILIVTKHQKEQIIAPFFSEHFNSNCIVSNHFDTDTLGTFCGEVDRKDDPISTLRKKCILGLKNTNWDIAIASEGSFGSHPIMFMAPFSEEYMMLYDQKNQIEIIAKESTTDTNFDERVVKNIDELLDFAKKTKFPSHGLILKTMEGEAIVKKGIVALDELKSSFERLSKTSTTILALTDMRAQFNPTRMEVIKRLAQKLILKIQSTCEQCSYPGFDIEEVKKGLPCEMCNMPTESSLAHIKRCKQCSFEKIIWHPNSKKFEAPMYCNFCNP